VALVASDRGRSTYRAVNSCLMLLPTAAGHEIYTVEALARSGTLSDAQQAMAAAGGSQCGYCTPGFVMSLFAEHYRPGRTGPCDPHALAGNLCRCTGYRPIRDAALSLGPAPTDAFAQRLDRPAPALSAVASDTYSRPTSVEACIEILTSRPGAIVIAGGSDLGVDANLRGRRWSHLVSVDAIDELREFSSTDRGVRIGAALPLTDIGHRWTDAPAAVAEWLELFASPPIRNRATLGGNLATASPIGDSAPLLMALDARVHLAGPNGRRALDLSTFFTGYRKTAMTNGEIMTTIEIPRPWPRLLRFYKVSKRRLDDISTVAAALALDVDDGRRVRRSRFAYGGVAATPVRVTAVEDALEGAVWNDSAVERAQRALERAIAPITDVRGSKEYRRAVSRALIDKFYGETRA
jgi:xanthine dehydrogenase small subunit